MLALLVLALVAVPVLELYVIVQVAHGIGLLPTLAVLVVLSVLGATLLRREGSRTWRSLREALTAGRLPAREVADGALVLLGGALLLTPGFVTDAVGLVCILPPTRAVLRRLLTAVTARRLGMGGLVTDRFGRPGPRPSSKRVRQSRHEVVEGEVVDDPDAP